MNTNETPTTYDGAVRVRRLVSMLLQALQTAAEEAYKSEVVDTQMENSVIGDNGTHQSRAQWIEERIEEWKHPNSVVNQNPEAKDTP